MTSASPDMTIRDIRVTMLRMPWADDPWLKGHALGPTRDILICEIETAGGITGMGYLFLFRPGMKSKPQQPGRCQRAEADEQECRQPHPAQHGAHAIESGACCRRRQRAGYRRHA